MPNSSAIVVGGSVVGCVVATVLADHFDNVIILERDYVPDAAKPRPGVPHSRHVHALLARGATELEALFPGFLSDMVTRGAQLVDIGRDVAWLTPGGWGARFQSGMELCCATRDLIESNIRRRTLERRTITLVDGIAVLGLIANASRTRVIGVRLRDRREAATAPHHELHADLVVDTSGRSSQLPEWLAEIGRPSVPEQVIDAGMTYASRFYAVDHEALRGFRAGYVQAGLPKHPKGGILFPVEDNRWHLTLFGYHGANPPMDEKGFRSFIGDLRSPILSDVLRHAKPLTSIVGHRRTANRWRRFDQVQTWPDGLLAAGDSVCCFDPVYGQGMTTGILGALLIRAHLGALKTGWLQSAGFSRTVQRALVRVIRPAWDLATSEDLRLATTTGGKLTARDRLLQSYFDRVVAAATSDIKVRRRLLSVMNMVAGPETLMHPRVMAGVLREMCGWNTKPEPLWPERERIRAAFPRRSGVVALSNR